VGSFICERCLLCGLGVTDLLEPPQFILTSLNESKGKAESLSPWKAGSSQFLRGDQDGLFKGDVAREEKCEKGNGKKGTEGGKMKEERGFRTRRLKESDDLTVEKPGKRGSAGGVLSRIMKEES